MNHYQPLPLHHLDAGAGYFRPQQQLPNHVSGDDPALTVMTDLSQVTAYTTELATPLSTALGTEIASAHGIAATSTAIAR